jgi:hypothetical protein
VAIAGSRASGTRLRFHSSRVGRAERGLLFGALNVGVNDARHAHCGFTTLPSIQPEPSHDQVVSHRETCVAQTQSSIRPPSARVARKIALIPRSRW